ncbi:nitrate reductase molybdenum cofactor assembly chaperone [Cupriavidus basilensis]|uniref:nitrate reductase molybdenum cofactor assembly chaperone n=3 Tax=Cupriavidus TaxID=106589 RepID=UPI0007515B3D|nr:nitrate reductase molybdenum cofactor assembly chaperone [Cupriavidus basilensis]
MKPFDARICLALARLLAYPGDELRASLAPLRDCIAHSRALGDDGRDGLLALVDGMRQRDPYELEAGYVDTFDRGRATALHLFEHVHGDSRERGQALVDLLRMYEAAGLALGPGELPDYLPVVLEFAATQPAPTARAFLAEMAHILNAVHAALAQRHSPYRAAIAAVLELAGERVEPVRLPPEEPLDEAWAEPPAFDGCATRGQDKPGAPQPIHFVRRDGPATGARS